jgi:NAD(P)-dependent dehydrogenase (short-subunit alcohol dehydrogenase family)
MQDMTIFITGATSGMGRHLARDLAVRGATLLLHGRDQSKLDQLAAELTPWASAVRTYVADLADLDQVRSMAARILNAEPYLDVLVNNAAVGGGTDPTKRETSRQGHELRLAVNHLAPHLLTHKLAPLLAAAVRRRQPSRAHAQVVNVASLGQAPIDFGDLMLIDRYEGVHAYCRSKLALIMGTFDLAERLAEHRITVNALHPAHLMDTEMVRQSGFTPAASIDDGVLPTLRMILDSALQNVTGRYYDRFDPAPAHEQAYDRAARSLLNEATHALISGAPTDGLPTPQP